MFDVIGKNGQQRVPELMLAQNDKVFVKMLISSFEPMMLGKIPVPTVVPDPTTPAYKVLLKLLESIDNRYDSSLCFDDNFPNKYVCTMLAGYMTFDKPNKVLMLYWKLVRVFDPGGVIFASSACLKKAVGVRVALNGDFKFQGIEAFSIAGTFWAFYANILKEYLNSNSEVVIRHWTCTSSDNSGRRKLVAILIEHEPHPIQQVPLLLSIEEEDTTVVKAIETSDTDLVYMALFHIWQRKPPLEFLGAIVARLLAQDLCTKCARDYDQRSLGVFYLPTGRPQDVVHLLFFHSWEVEKNTVGSREGGSALQGSCIRLIEDAHKFFAQTKEHIEATTADEHAKLLRILQDLETATKQVIFVHSSTRDTIGTCIIQGNFKAAMKVWVEFKDRCCINDF